MLARLTKEGALLSNEDLVVAEFNCLDKDDGVVIDLSVDEDEGHDKGEEDLIGQDGARGVYVKDVMGRLVAPELQTIRTQLPETYMRIN